MVSNTTAKRLLQYMVKIIEKNLLLKLGWEYAEGALRPERKP